MCAADRRPAIHLRAHQGRLGSALCQPGVRTILSHPARNAVHLRTIPSSFAKAKDPPAPLESGYKLDSRPRLCLSASMPEQAPKLLPVRQGLFGAARLTLRTVRRHDRRRFALAFLRLLCRLRSTKGSHQGPSKQTKTPAEAGVFVCLAESQSVELTFISFQ